MDWTNLWADVLHWVANHATIAYAAIFLIASSESLALVGLLIPGTVVMIGIGALAGSGALSLTVTFLVAMAGAIVGDGISYWLGRHYHLGLKKLWPFCRFPQLLSRGEDFFLKHGGKSVLIGRFVGPVRPIIPVIAGMLDMPVGRFVLVNVFSAIGWAFAYLVPGVLLGGSLTLIGSVSTRLSLLLLMLLLLLWATFSLCHHTFNWLGRLAPQGERLLPVLVLVLFIAGWVFLGVLEDVVNMDPLVQADQAIYHFLQSLRTPWGDWILIAVTELGDGLVSLPIGLTVLLFLLLSRKPRAARFWLLALGGGAAMVQLFKWTLHRPRPIDIYQGVSSWGFPSGHTTMSVVLFGFLAILLVRSFPPRWRWLPFSVAIGISAVIAFSRIYIGAHWFSDVVGGMSLGWAWVTLLGILYLRGSGQVLSKGLLVSTVFLTLLIAGGWHVQAQHSQDLVRYQIQRTVKDLQFQGWQEQAWQNLPARRLDLAGEFEEPLNFQWAGDPEQLSAQLIAKGWKQNVSLDLKQILNCLVPNVKLSQLPVFPLLENGRQERLVLYKLEDDHRLILRLWPTNFKLMDINKPLWAGTVDSEIAVNMAHFFTLPHGSREYSMALHLLGGNLPSEMLVKWVNRPVQGTAPSGRWDGQTLLLTHRGTTSPH